MNSPNQAILFRPLEKLKLIQKKLNPVAQN